MYTGRFPIIAALVALAMASTAPQLQAQDASIKKVLEEQAKRTAVVEKVSPSVVAVFAAGGKGGGSGVLISKDGYALTNFHVVQPAGPVMQCGLSDGVLYDAVLVGWDKVGDVALIKLLPKKEGDEFPFAPMGDSDKVREGDWSMAMGNPFLLATDFTPTVTFGMVSGVHRYQYPAGTLLEYTDCIQIDTSINPGNSGGPLFNMDGELIGINGRGSFDKRGRVNSGVGYAISINQIKNFMGHLKAGLDADHASLGALVTSESEGAGLGRVLVSTMLTESDVARRGLELDDEIISFDGRVITSVNHYKNVLGLYPRDWRVPLEFRRRGSRKEILVRLMGVQRRNLEDESGPQKKEPQGKQPPINKKSPAAKFYEPREPALATKQGFANYYFNKLERDRVLAGFAKHGTFEDRAGPWTLTGMVRFRQLNNESPFKLEIIPAQKSADAQVEMKVDVFPPYTVHPNKENPLPGELKQPAGSGGFLAAMYLYHRFLTQGLNGFTEAYHAGTAPIYPRLPDGRAPEDWKDQRIMAEVIHTRFGVYLTQWYFSPEDHKLIGFEVRESLDEDPCEVYLFDYGVFEGKPLPRRIQVVYADGHYGTFQLRNAVMAASK